MLESLPGLVSAGPHPPDEGGGEGRRTRGAPNEGSAFDALVRRATRGGDAPLGDPPIEEKSPGAIAAGLAAWLPPPQAVVEETQHGPDRFAEVLLRIPSTTSTVTAAASLVTSDGEAAGGPGAGVTPATAQIASPNAPLASAAATPSSMTIDEAAQPSTAPEVAAAAVTAAAGSQRATPNADGAPDLGRAAERIATQGTPAEGSRADAPRIDGPRAQTSAAATQPEAGSPAAMPTEVASQASAAARAEVESARVPDGGQSAAVPVSGVNAPAAGSGAVADVAAAESTTNADAVELAARLAETVHAAATRGPRELRVSLRPPELGHLDLRVVEGPNGLRVAIEASTSDARDLLQRELPALRAALEGRDLRVQRLDVQLADRGESGMLADGGPADRRDQPGRGQGRNADGGAADGGPGSSRTARTSDVDAATTAVASGRIDLRV